MIPNLLKLAYAEKLKVKNTWGVAVISKVIRSALAIDITEHCSIIEKRMPVCPPMSFGLGGFSIFYEGVECTNEPQKIHDYY